ncbi:MAG TPA: hypothetical protein VMT34_04810, partial [Aggregatilineales bacterium]|nr:hypothetical protein [Aggregatilineales bacterium]
VTLDNVSHIQQMGSLNDSHTTINRFSFSHSRDRLLTIGGDLSMLVWDLHSGKPVFGPLPGVTFGFFDAKDSLVVGAGHDGQVKFFSATDGKLIQQSQGNTNGVSFATMSPDGTTFLTGGANGDIWFWSVAQRVVTRTIPALSDTGGIQRLVFAPDGTYFASIASRDVGVRLWNVANGELIAVLIGFTTFPTDVVFAADGGAIAVAAPQELFVFDGHQRNLLYKFHADDLASENGLAFSPNHKMLAAASTKDRVYVWSAADGSALASLPDHVGMITWLAFSPNSQFLVTMTRAGGQGAYLWNTATFVAGSSKYARATIAQNSNGFFRAVWSPSGDALYLADLSGAIMVWGVP